MDRFFDRAALDELIEFPLGESDDLAKYAAIVVTDRGSGLKSATGRTRQTEWNSRCRDATLLEMRDLFEELAVGELWIPSKHVLGILNDARG